MALTHLCKVFEHKRFITVFTLYIDLNLQVDLDLQHLPELTSSRVQLFCCFFRWHCNTTRQSKKKIRRHCSSKKCSTGSFIAVKIFNIQIYMTPFWSTSALCPVFVSTSIFFPFVTIRNSSGVSCLNLTHTHTHTHTLSLSLSLPPFVLDAYQQIFTHTQAYQQTCMCHIIPIKVLVFSQLGLQALTCYQILVCGWWLMYGWMIHLLFGISW